VDQFEIVLISLSIILGLSMGHMLWTAAAVVRYREQVELDWLPFAWAACIFLQHAHFWFSAFSVNLDIGTWTWTWYLQILAHAVLLFAAGALVLPTEAQLTGALRVDFEKHGRLALIPFVAYQLLWFPTNFRADQDVSQFIDLLRPGNLANFILIALLITGFRAKKRVLQSATVITFGLVLAWASTFAWAQNAF
jgi:hypothetical protein